MTGDRSQPTRGSQPWVSWPQCPQDQAAKPVLGKAPSHTCSYTWSGAQGINCNYTCNVHNRAGCCPLVQNSEGVKGQRKKRQIPTCIYSYTQPHRSHWKSLFREKAQNGSWQQQLPLEQPWAVDSNQNKDPGHKNMPDVGMA